MNNSKYLVRFRYLCEHCFQYEDNDVEFTSYYSALRCLALGMQKLSFDSAWLIDISNGRVDGHIIKGGRILYKVDFYGFQKGGINNETQR